MHRIDLGPRRGAGEGLRLPRAAGRGAGAAATTISAVANAKSSTGRLDLFTRLITDRGTEFDRIEAGYAGPLYAEISPRSFSVLVRPGMRLNQIRFRRGSAVLDDAELRALDAAERLVERRRRTSPAASPSRSTSSRAAAASSATAPSRTPA